MAENYDLAPLLKDAPRNCWLAFNEEQTAIVGHGETIEETLERAVQAGVPDPILFWNAEVLAPRVL